MVFLVTSPPVTRNTIMVFLVRLMVFLVTGEGVTRNTEQESMNKTTNKTLPCGARRKGRKANPTTLN
jgi:hypothetical protein